MSGPRLDPVGPPLAGAQMMSQQWRDLVFLHWRIDPARVERFMPPGTRPDLFDGSAWVGLIPFRLTDAGVSRGPAVPYLGTFIELNVRLYSVDEQGRHGVVFLSLDCERLAVVAGAQATFALPYQWASMGFHHEPASALGPGSLTYTSRRFGLGPRSRLRSRPRSRPRSRIAVEVGVEVDEPSDLEHFLTARFGLHTVVLGRTRWIPNTHGAWPLRRATLLECDDQLVAAAGLPGVVASGPPDSVLCSQGVRTVFGLPQPLG